MRRINRCVELLEEGQPVYYDRVGALDLSYETGRDLCGTWADYLRIEFEHEALNTVGLCEFMQGLKDAGPTRSGHPTPTVMCTIPATGITEDEVRVNSWQIRHILSSGVHGLYLAHARDPRAVHAFVQACRFPHQTDGLNRGLDVGTRGHGAEDKAAAIWGLDTVDYMRRADPWPLNPTGELILGVKVEDRFGLEHVDACMAVPGVTFGEWGPGDMALFLGHLGVKDPPYSDDIDDAWRRVKASCDKAGIRFLCTWDDPALTPDQKAELLVREIGASLIASGDGEAVAAAGRKLTGRTLPV